MFSLIGKIFEKRDLRDLVGVLDTPCCDVTLAWPSAILTTVACHRKWLHVVPLKLSPCIIMALFFRAVGGFVTAPVGISILYARHEIVPRFLREGIGRC